MKQHYITRAYLADFTDPETPAGQEPYIWVLERESKAAFRRAPHKVAVKTDYYTAKVEGKPDNVIEDVLGHVESIAIPVTRALAAGKQPRALGEVERGSLAYYLGLLETRVPKYRGFVERLAADLMLKILRMSAERPEYFVQTVRQAYQQDGKRPPIDIESARKFVLSGEYDVVVDPLFSLQSMVAQAPRIAEYVDRFEWRVLDAPPGTAFITSDAPLVRVTTEPQPAEWLGVGWLTPWMEATFPLSPKACLLVSQHRPAGREMISAETVAEVNRRTAAHATSELYSSRELVLEAVSFPSEASRWQPATDAILPNFRVGGAKF